MSCFGSTGGGGIVEMSCFASTGDGGIAEMSKLPNNVRKTKKLLHNSFELKKEFSFSEIYTLYSILKEYDIYTNESWMKTELAIASIDGCMKELKYNDIGLTDILKQKINELNELENSELLN